MGRRAALAIVVSVCAPTALGACLADERPDRPDPGEILYNPPPPTGQGDEPNAAPFVEPALSGGTILVTPDGARAVVSDPARDRVLVVALGSGSVDSIALEQGDEPGRAAIDAAGRAHVLLRGSSQILTIDLDDLSTRRLKTCTGPRGIAFDEATNILHVAGVRGDIWSHEAPTGAVIRKHKTDPDLRDVVVRGDRLFVTRFRSAELLVLDADGTVVFRTTPPMAGFVARVAWRMIPVEGGVAIAHQGASNREIEIGPATDPGEYQAAEDCSASLVTAAVTVYRETPSGELEPSTRAFPFQTLPVDLTISPDASELSMTSAGFGALTTFKVDTLAGAPVPCDESTFQPMDFNVLGDVVGAAYAGTKLLVQTREPSGLHVIEGTAISTIDLGGKSLENAGYQLFHRGNTGVPTITCASCHPEGREDGHVWRFSTIGPRRTQSLLGGIANTAPFHWDGDLPDMERLMSEVFLKRMGQLPLGQGELDDMIGWLDGLKQLPSQIHRADRIGAGRAAFEKAGCDDCHVGDRLQSSGSFDVGTGKSLQVPSLIGVAARTPLMHDGCAPTLQARFEDETCGGNDHGNVAALSDAEMTDLLRYLEAL